MPDILDYDPGLLNDYGGGNVDWWFDYIRAEINRCNEYWREQFDHAENQQVDSADPDRCGFCGQGPEVSHVRCLQIVSTGC